jgi:hypothetical protein
MKTTIELPDELLREAKATAARRGTALKEYFKEALQEKLSREGLLPQDGPKQWPVPPPDVPIEVLDQIDEFIERAFERVDSEE